MFKKRIASGLTLAAIILLAAARLWFFNIAITVFIALASYEFFTILEKKRINIYKYFGTGIAVLIPFSIIFRFEPTKGWELLFICLALIFLFLMQFRRRETAGVTVGISTTLFGVLYVAWFLSFLIKIRYMEGGPGLFFALLLITKSGDIGAYLIGSSFGRTLLIPRISAKKTVEGALAGLLFSCLSALASKPFLHFNYPHLLVIGICLGVLGQLGDLSESLIKRDCGVKDSGRFLPGMGGILDEVDSLLFTAPVFYFYLSIIGK
ncbi:MAG: phosphatidate cytidylyltransferase [Candidatus Omnitrophota bacterium]